MFSKNLLHTPLSIDEQSNELETRRDQLKTELDNLVKRRNAIEMLSEPFVFSYISLKTIKNEKGYLLKAKHHFSKPYDSIKIDDEVESKALSHHSMHAKNIMVDTIKKLCDKFRYNCYTSPNNLYVVYPIYLGEEYEDYKAFCWDIDDLLSWNYKHYQQELRKNCIKNKGKDYYKIENDITIITSKIDKINVELSELSKKDKKNYEKQMFEKEETQEYNENRRFRKI